MNDDIDQLSETFAAHEHLAPNPDDVLVRAKAIARSYQRRRWAVRATGGAVLGAGLVAGGIALPGRLGHASSGQTVASVRPADGGTSSPSAAPVVYTQDQDWAAYFAAGYDYADAQQLATLWHDSSDIGTIKAQAGLKLLEGQALPIKPSGTPETAADKAQTAFFAAGYDYNDAVALSKKWHETDITHVKVQAGEELLAGKTLPITPSEGTFVKGQPDSGTTGGSVATPTKEDAALSEFFAEGYDYNDAVSLAKIWHESDVFSVKAEAGQKLLDGKKLPIPPSGTAETESEKEQNAYINAGYTYDDALSLGKIWHETDITQIKNEAGQDLLDGKKLPIGP